MNERYRVTAVRGMSDITMHVAERLRERRKALGLSQAQMAESGGLGRTQYTNIEAGRSGTPLPVLEALMAAVGMKWADLDGPCTHAYQCIYCGAGMDPYSP